MNREPTRAISQICIERLEDLRAKLSKSIEQFAAQEVEVAFVTYKKITDGKPVGYKTQRKVNDCLEAHKA